MSAVSRYVCQTEMNSNISMPRAEDGPQEVALTPVLSGIFVLLSRQGPLNFLLIEATLLVVINFENRTVN